MKFCTSCGKQLGDNEVCTCQSQNAMAGQVQQTAGQNKGNANGMPDFLENIIDYCKGAIKKPADAVENFVAKGNLISSVLMFAVCGFLIMISGVVYKVLVNIQGESNAMQNYGIWGQAFYQPTYSAWRIILGAVGDILFTFVSGFLIAGIVYAFIKFVLEKTSDVKFGSFLAAIAVSEFMMLPFNVVGTVLNAVPYLGGFFFTFGNGLGLIAVALGLKKCVKDSNNLFLSYAVALLANCAVSIIFSLIGLN